MKKFLMYFSVMLLAFALAACTVTDKVVEATIVFEGAGTITVKSDGGNYEIPELELSDGQTLVGWALREGSTTPLVVEEVSYDDIIDYISNNTLHLYPVIESKIELTIHGVTDVKTTLSNSTMNQAVLPLVDQNERQQFLGWTNEPNGTEVVIDASTVINFDVVKNLAVKAKVELYPVVKSYDIMICVHASHSNGNVYVSTEQRAQLKSLVEQHFAEENLSILIDFVDAVSATNFAAEAVKKDYDILLTSKTARNKGNDAGDIQTAALLNGLTYYAEADADETILSCIDLNQSRQVCRMLGGNMEKPYQDALYQLLTSPIDEIVEITFKNGDLEEQVEAHRVVEGELNNASYVPENEAIMKKTGCVFDGWKLMDGEEEVLIANASYANIYKYAVNGKVTLEAVFAPEPDAYFVVWGINGTNEYVSAEQFEQMKELFYQYVAANQINIEGKKIEFEYFEGKTAEFQSKLTLNYVSAAVGAAALSNDAYAQYWTINKDLYAPVLNVACTNASRYCAVRDTYSNDEITLAFLHALCEATIKVHFAYGDVLTDGELVNSLTKNELELPDAIEVPGDKFLVGYGLTANDTEPAISASVTYANVKAHATDGEITLYPIFDSYDLVVYVWGGQSKTGTTYVTEEEAEQLKADFITALGDSATGKKIVFNVVWGKTDNYGALVGSEADVIISGPKLNTSAQCGDLLDEALGKFEVIHYSFTNNSTRYVGLCTKALQNELAKELMIYLAEDELTVTFNGGAAQTLKKIYNENELVLPSVNVNEGYELAGWSTIEYAEEAEFTNDGLTFDALAQKATNKSITLYPVIVQAIQSDKITVVVAYHSTYFTNGMLSALQTMLDAELEKEGYGEDDYEITWNAYSGKVADASAAIVNDGADVCIAHTQVFNSSKTDTPFVCAAAYPATVFSTKDAGHTFTCGSDLKVGVASGSANNPIAAMIYSLLVNYKD